MRFVRGLVASTTLLVGLTSALDARAQTSGQDAATAQALVDDGKRLMQLGKHAEACPKLIDSQRLDPGAGTLLAIALCHEGEGKTATACADFNVVLTDARRDRRPDRETAATEHIRALEKKLTRVTISVEQKVEGLEVRRDGAPVGEAQWSTPLPIDPGEHRFEARAPGRKPWENAVAVAGDGAVVDVRVPALEVAPAVAAVEAPVVPPPAPPVVVPAPTAPSFKPVDDKSSSRRTHMTSASTVGGAGLAFLRFGRSGPPDPGGEASARDDRSGACRRACRARRLGRERRHRAEDRRRHRGHIGSHHARSAPGPRHRHVSRGVLCLHALDVHAGDEDLGRPACGRVDRDGDASSARGSRDWGDCGRRCAGPGLGRVVRARDVRRAARAGGERERSPERTRHRSTADYRSSSRTAHRPGARSSARSRVANAQPQSVRSSADAAAGRLFRRAFSDELRHHTGLASAR